MSITVTPITTPTITAWQITPATAADVQVALATVAMIGWKGTITSFIQPNSSTLVWTVTLARSGYASLVGGENDWIVSDGTNVSMLDNDVFVATYTPTAS